MIRDSRGSGYQSKFKYPLIVLLGFGLLFISASAFSQSKEEKAEHRAEKRKEIKHFFKKLNPFKKDKGDDGTAATTESTQAQPQTQAVPPPAPEPVPQPATVKPEPGTTPPSTKHKTTSTKPKKTSKPKTDKVAQPLI